MGRNWRFVILCMNAFLLQLIHLGSEFLGGLPSNVNRARSTTASSPTFNFLRPSRWYASKEVRQYVTRNAGSAERLSSLSRELFEAGPKDCVCDPTGRDPTGSTARPPRGSTTTACPAQGPSDTPCIEAPWELSLLRCACGYRLSSAILPFEAGVCAPAEIEITLPSSGRAPRARDSRRVNETKLAGSPASPSPKLSLGATGIHMPNSAPVALISRCSRCSRSRSRSYLK